MADARRILKATFAVSLLALAAVLAVPTFTGRPIVSYASSGSMEPTIGVLDGFFVNPWPGALGPGDIVVFYSVTRDTAAVHRIVAVEGEGWITQGDANPQRDQDAGEPTLTRDRVLGKVLTGPDGAPILVEGLGSSYLEARAKLVTIENVFGGPRQLAALGFLLVALTFAVPALFTRKKRELPKRLPLRARVLLRRILPRGILGRHVAMVLLVIVLSGTLVAATKAHHDVTTTIIALQDPSAADETRAAGAGQELPRDLRIASLGFIPTVVVIDPSGHVRPGADSWTLGPGGRADVRIWQRAGDVVGLQEDVVPVWRYPAFLPAGAIVALHGLAPGAPYLALGALAIAVGAIWFAALRIRTLPVARTLGIQEEWL